MDFLIITGLSGAGKSQVADVLEDIGYFCIDNMPPELIPKFSQIMIQSEISNKIAVVTDVRTGELFKGLFDSIVSLKDLGINCKILFLDSSDQILMRRYSESRRKHPLVTEINTSTRDAIKDERALLAPVKNMADFYIDTSVLSLAQLKARISAMFLENDTQSLIITCLSFGFKHDGIPSESDLVLDVRCLDNPYYYPELRDLTGIDKEVYEFVWSFEESNELFNKYSMLIDYLIPLYIKEGKSQLVISIGCTGGHHRSVAFAERLTEHIKKTELKCKTIHRDILK